LPRISVATDDIEITPVAGDASHRKYLRLSLNGEHRILLISPPELENNQAFLDVRNLLEQHQLRVPACYAVDIDHGFMLLEDFGDTLLLDLLDDQSVGQLYPQAQMLLLRLAQMKPFNLPSYNQASLIEEMDRFAYWFVEKLLGQTMGGEGVTVFSSLQDALVRTALEQPQVVVHRDFHSRNLMRLPDNELGIIDFQDAVIGGITYDLVSLLKDCYIRWPAPKVVCWALEFKQMLESAGQLQDVTDEEFLKWFDWMGMQRHIKVLGTFARLSLRDNKHAYLNDLPLVLDYVVEALHNWAGVEPVCADFLNWFDSELQPVIAQQPWMAGAQQQ